MNDNSDLQSLRSELESQGCFEPDPWRIMAQLLLHLILTGVGLIIYFSSDSTVAASASIVMWSAGMLGVATNTHSAAHYSAFRGRRTNEFATYMGFSVITGISTTHWWHKHGMHHRHPNVIGRDSDCDLMPFFATTVNDTAECGAIRQAYYRYQIVILPFAIALNAINWQRASIVYLATIILQRERRTQAHWIDASCLALHFLSWVVIPSCLLGCVPVATFWAVRYAVLGWATFLVFAPSHFPRCALCVEPSQERVDFVLLQTATTINYRAGHVGRWFTSGLENQIEHHLFPGVSHTRYADVADIVRKYCNSRGYPYRTFGWGAALKEVFAIFLRPKQIAGTLSELPGH